MYSGITPWDARPGAIDKSIARTPGGDLEGKTVATAAAAYAGSGLVTPAPFIYRTTTIGGIYISLVFTSLKDDLIRHIDESFKEIPVSREAYPVGEKFDLRFKGFYYLDPRPKEVIFHDPATIVYWTDGTKTVVKCGPHDTFDPEHGLAMAIAKKQLGSEFHKVFRKWVQDES